MEKIQHIFFINLEHRLDRLVHVTQQLNNLGVFHKAERFPAIKLKSGPMGCTMSHIKCLELAIARNYDNIFICEDDITFLDIPSFTKGIEQFFQDTNPKPNSNPNPKTTSSLPWDVLIVGGNNSPPFQKVSDFYMRIHNCQSTTGYIVNKHYYKTLLNNFRDGLNLLIKETTNTEFYAIDMYWKRLQVIHKWYLIIPTSVVQIESYSDVEGKVVDYTSLMLDYDKKKYLNSLNSLNATKNTKSSPE